MLNYQPGAYNSEQKKSIAVLFILFVLGLLGLGLFQYSDLEKETGHTQSLVFSEKVIMVLVYIVFAIFALVAYFYFQRIGQKDLKHESIRVRTSRQSNRMKLPSELNQPDPFAEFIAAEAAKSGGKSPKSPLTHGEILAPSALPILVDSSPSTAFPHGEVLAPATSSKDPAANSISFTPYQQGQSQAVNAASNSPSVVVEHSLAPQLPPIAGSRTSISQAPTVEQKQHEKQKTKISAPLSEDAMQRNLIQPEPDVVTAQVILEDKATEGTATAQLISEGEAKDVKTATLLDSAAPVPTSSTTTSTKMPGTKNKKKSKKKDLKSSRKENQDKKKKKKTKSKSTQGK